jgi:hypothetical protein
MSFVTWMPLVLPLAAGLMAGVPLYRHWREFDHWLDQLIRRMQG